MLRIQVYLTQKERDGLASIAQARGKKQSELIREAVDRFIDFARGAQRQAILNEAAGMWRDRDDLPDFAEMRSSWERG